MTECRCHSFLKETEFVITQMEKKLSDIDLADIMEHPQDYTEDQVREFFTDEQHRLEYIAVLRAKQAIKRSETPAPDVEKAWEQFCAQNIEEPKTSKKTSKRENSAFFRQTFGYALAALSGAAAMLLAVLLLWHPNENNIENNNLLTVLEYDDTPQNLIMLIDGEKEQTLQPSDSISFYEAGTATTGTTSSVGQSKTKEEPRYRTLKTPRGMDLKIILPDGSEVWLNAESSLEFPTAFTDTRHVELVGEAYFKVARDEQKPFIVTTDKMNVKVLGTEFNFRNYDTENAQVALVNGSVEILKADETSAHIVLQPGEAANLGNDGHISVHPVNTYDVNQWTKGFFYFHDKTLEAALQEIGRWYNVSVLFENRGKLNEKIHFSALRGETLQQTLDKLNLLMDTKIVSVGNKIIVR